MKTEIYEMLKEFGHDAPFIIPTSHLNVGIKRNGKPWTEFISSDMASTILRHEA